MRQSATRFLIAAIVLVTVLPHAAQAAAHEPPRSTVHELPSSMASIGESISKGALARFTRRDAWNPLRMMRLFKMLTDFLMTKSVSAVEFSQFSWSTGMDPGMQVDSHAQRLSFYNDRFAQRDFAVYEAARSGENSDSIQGQLDAVESWSESALGRALPDYLVYLVGPNDACDVDLASMTPVETYESRVRAMIERVRKRSPRTRLLLSSSPDVGRLREVARNARAGVIGSCPRVWKMTGFCNNILLEKDPSKREQAIRRVHEYNETLARLALEYRERDGRDWIRYGSRVSEIRFTANDISVDCFHPSRSGQQLLAEATWQDSWWSELPGEYADAYESYKSGR